MSDLFSPAGVAAWRARLEQSTAFRDAARGWTGTVLLVERNDPHPDRASYLAVESGVLRDARPATPADADEAEFVLHASAGAWRALARGEEELVAAALRGVLTLERGSVWRLIPHARAASAMLREGADADRA